MNYSVPFSVADKLGRAIIDERPMGQVSKIYVQADPVLGDDIEFVGLYFEAKFGEDGLKVSYVSSGATEAELGGTLPAEGDIVVKIGSLDIKPDTCIADIFAECLKYKHDSSLSTAALKVVLLRDGKTVTLTYNAKRLRY